MTGDPLLLHSPSSALTFFNMSSSATTTTTTTTTANSNTSSHRRIANGSPPLKRTYQAASRSSNNPPSPSDREACSPSPFKVRAVSTTTTPTPSPGRMPLSIKRPYPFPRPPASAAGRDIDMTGCSPIAEFHKPGLPSVFASSPQEPRSSISTTSSSSSSTNTSPTTTISTVDTTATPDTSPDSPAGCRMMSPPFKSTRPRTARPNELSIPPPSPLLQKGPLSPSKKPRNTKNLSLNFNPPPTPSQDAPQLSPRASQQPNADQNGLPTSMSAPPSPGFILPPPSANPRRRPSNLGLTIKLPGTLGERSGLRAGTLRHHQSSPALQSPAVAGPPGGMTLPQSASFRQTTFQFSRPSFNTRWADRHDSIASAGSSASPPRSPGILLEEDEDDSDEHEPRSGEAKSPAYPQGPALIFEPNIYLYSEPDAQLAGEFDVVINVAREVLNPFEEERKQAARLSTGTIPDTACTDASFTTAFEHPIWSPVRARKTPEYVHMPWDHNTPILADLPALVQLIHTRSREGKRVLVHCQCGVSRSATLLIAYEMFVHPHASMQDAYSAVKRRSKWIGPNMSLIYQLTDWKKQLAAGAAPPPPPSEPQTAPLPDRRGFPRHLAADDDDDADADAPSPPARSRSESGGAEIAPPQQDRLSWPDAAERVGLGAGAVVRQRWPPPPQLPREYEEPPQQRNRRSGAWAAMLKDPRSPTEQQGERAVVRNIFDVL